VTDTSLFGAGALDRVIVPVRLEPTVVGHEFVAPWKVRVADGLAFRPLPLPTSVSQVGKLATTENGVPPVAPEVTGTVTLGKVLGLVQVTVTGLTVKPLVVAVTVTEAITGTSAVAP
jgi:hypothetical protein